MAGDKSTASPAKGVGPEEIVELPHGGVDKNRVFELIRQRGVRV